VIRVSGEKTETVLRRIIAGLPGQLVPNRAYHGFVTQGHEKIDECVTVFFKAPHSYTGEDLAEISVHANPFIIEAVLAAISDPVEGVRPALPGEFTYRAFKNGKIDLIQAEAVNELIDANSRCFAAMTFASLEGKLSQMIGKIRQELVDLGIMIETRIEFQEDQQIGPIPMRAEVETAIQAVQKVLENARFNDLINRGLRVVIVGRVNVGKSSLFNTLLMQERAITSAKPGTTRDYLQEKLFISGLPVEITDGAGLNPDTRDDIEVQGIRRSLEKITASDAVIFVLDASAAGGEADRQIFELIKDKRRLLAVNKIDIADPQVLENLEAQFPGEKKVEISVRENINIEAIRAFLDTLVQGIKGPEIELAVNRRQKTLLERLLEILNRLKEKIDCPSSPVEIMAEEIRQALQVIGELTGRITQEDILQGIFSRFCIGK
jgi:tRNA modification GTPase